MKKRITKEQKALQTAKALIKSLWAGEVDFAKGIKKLQKYRGNIRAKH